MAERESSGALGTFLFGTAVGAVLGLLFAPKEGSETREQLNDWLQEKREKSSELVRNLREKTAAQRGKVAAAFRHAKEEYVDN
jgi:gas vesicle protein